MQSVVTCVIRVAYIRLLLIYQSILLIILIRYCKYILINLKFTVKSYYR